MTVYVIIFAASVLVSQILSPYVIKVAQQKGLVDYPDHGVLKTHKTPVPNIGGSIIVLSTTLLVLASFPIFSVSFQRLSAILILGFIVLLVGLVDDQKNISPWIRLGVHSAVAVALMLFGVKLNISAYAGFNFLITALVVIGLINAFNLLDGLDGLAAGVSAICFLSFAAIGLVQVNGIVVLLSLAVAGSLIGFLPFNFHVAKIFLGDGGSTFIGFNLAVLLILIGAADKPQIYFAAGVIVVALPVMDTGLSIVRRLRQHQNIFTGDRDHFYDQLIRRGFSCSQTAILGYTITMALSIISLSIVLLWG